jgi:RsiW-degrading membrane proteinase PrsW (M82 family)
MPGSPSWQVCDLGSANGTYLNGQRIQGCHPLKAGDRLILGQNGPQFLFEVPPVPMAASPRPSPGTPAQSAATNPVPPAVTAPAGSHSSDEDSVTVSQLFPIVRSGKDLRKKAFLIPGIITVSFVILMFLAVGTPVLFNLVLALYLAGGAYFFVYQLCGKRKPWWLMIAVAITTMILLISPVLTLFIIVFRGILPGGIPENYDSISFPVLFIRMFFGAGLMEELLKALPIFALVWLGGRLRSPMRERIGVWEPLDGILIGTASAVGFTLLETLGQYVPEAIQDATLQVGDGFGEVVGLQLLIPRILGSIAGHMAYSGYFGYFIGLSILKPSKRWQILGIGYLTSSLLHALWNSTGAISYLVLAVVGVASYAFLTAAILKARTLSPTRSDNFATMFTRVK